jgi:hypothetical protein
MVVRGQKIVVLFASKYGTQFSAAVFDSHKPILHHNSLPMSTATTDTVKKSRSKAKEKRQGQTKLSISDRLKTVVRRLPPNLPEQIFWQSVQTWVTDDTILWKEFYPGKVKKK